MNNRYNGLQINLNKKFSHGFTVQTNYTLSKATDGGDSSGAIFSSGSNRNPRDRSIDYGLSNFDHEQIFNVVYRWDIPFPSANRGLKTAFGGWRWGGITSATGGDPLTITSPTGFDDFSANSAWGNYVGGKAFGDHSTRALEASQYLNPSAFCEANAFGPGCVVDPNAGVTYLALGDSKRGIVRGPAALNFNMTLGKNFPISERVGTVRFDVEAFNLFNHTQLNDPNVDSSNLADFGKIFTANPPRRIQFAIHYVF